MKLILCVESAASSRTPGNREILAIVSLVLYLIEFRMFFTRTYEIYACGTFAPKGIKARKRNKRPRDSDIRSQSACFLYIKVKRSPHSIAAIEIPFSPDQSTSASSSAKTNNKDIRDNPPIATLSQKKPHPLNTLIMRRP